MSIHLSILWFTTEISSNSFQIVRVMNNICQQCNAELQTAHTFKLKCDRLNYDGRDATPKQELCEMCGKLESLDQHRDICRKIKPTVQVQTHDKPKAKKVEQTKPKINAGRDSLKFRMSTKNGNKWKVEKMERSRKMGKASMGVKSEPDVPVCPYCKFRFINVGGLRAHMMWHKIRRFPNQCSSCELSFLSDIDLRKHEKFDHWRYWIGALMLTVDMVFD